MSRESIIRQLQLDGADQAGLSEMFLIESILDHYAPDDSPVLDNCLLTSGPLDQTVFTRFGEIGPIRIDADLTDLTAPPAQTGFDYVFPVPLS